MGLLITNARIITESYLIERGWLLSDATRIAAFGVGDAPSFSSAQRIDAQGHTLMPGFIDLHVHGSAGHDTMDASPDAIQGMARFYAQHGVTSFLATTWTDTHPRIMAALHNIEAMLGPQPDGASLLGAHVEGPYLNPVRGGAQNLGYIRRAERGEASMILDTDVVRLLALAPEFTENHWLIEACVQRGITVSIAHTNASYDEAMHAIELGIRQSTHTYNAMTGLHHRDPGTLGAVMESPLVRCELIADNIHVHPAAMRILWQAKGPDGIILISDAIRAAGMPDGAYPVDERTIHVQDGAARLSDGTLAGSTLTLDAGLRNFCAASGASLQDAWQTLSLNPARAIHIGHRKGSIAIDKDADLVLLDPALQVSLTICEGRICYQRKPKDS